MCERFCARLAAVLATRSRDSSSRFNKKTWRETITRICNTASQIGLKSKRLNGYRLVVTGKLVSICPKYEEKNTLCLGGESNPGQLLGRQLCYHYTTKAS